MIYAHERILIKSEPTVKRAYEYKDDVSSIGYIIFSIQRISLIFFNYIILMIAVVQCSSGIRALRSLQAKTIRRQSLFPA